MNLTDIMLSKRNTEVSVQTKGIKMIESKLVVTTLVERDGELPVGKDTRKLSGVQSFIS